MKIVIIIPTYNERENIGILLDSLHAVFKKMSHDIKVLIVDDNSPDQTADVVRSSMEKYGNIFLITGEKKGIGAAYIRGMRHVVKQMHADAVMEMDADFSHDPEDVPRLIEAMELGGDFIIGSRYVPGGSIPNEWGYFRKLNSKWGNIFARYVAGMRNIKDCTAGFRAIRMSLLMKIELSNLRVTGYAFQIALLNKANLLRAKIIEVPVIFIDRKRGETKLGLSDILEFMKNAWWIRLENSKTFLRFITVGASGVLVNLSAFTLLLAIGISMFIASPIAIEISILSNFYLNYKWTFGQKRAETSISIKGLKFNLISLLSLGVSYTTFLLVSRLSPELPPQVPQLIGIVPATLVNYFLNIYWTFKEDVPAAQRTFDT